MVPAAFRTPRLLAGALVAILIVAACGTGAADDSEILLTSVIKANK